MEIRGDITRDRKLLAHKIICQVAKVMGGLTEDVVKKHTTGQAYGREIKHVKAVALNALKYYGFTHANAAEIIGLKGPNASNLNTWYRSNFTYMERKSIREAIQERVIR